MSCPFPQDKSGEHLIYAVWQRDDSPEAFYTCMDVEFTGGGPVVWRSIGELRARQDLSPGDTVTFRLFGPSGGDAETYTLVLEERQAGASEWPFYLAQVVNGSSSLVRIGIPDSDGNINPVLSSQENIVYTASGEEYSFQVDIEMDDNGGGTEPCDCCAQCGNDCQGPMGTEAEYTYPEGIGSYEEGTVVLGTDGNLYECRPFPNSGWCNQSGLYYAPGTGIAWEDAWTLIQ